MKVPADVYQRSQRKYNPSEPEYDSPCNFETRKVNSNAEVSWKDKKLYVSKALFAEYIGIEFINDDKLKIYFCDYPLCTVDSISKATLKKAIKLSGIGEKTALVRAGLQALITQETSKRLAELGGTEKSITAIRRRKA